MKNNVITWFDVPTADFNRAIKFYSAILGEEVKVMEHMGQKLGFFPMEGAGIGGDIVPPLDPASAITLNGIGHKVSDGGTRIYLNCEGHLQEVLGRVEASGGKILAPRFAIGESGFIAIIKDSEGNTIGLHSLK